MKSERMAKRSSFGTIMRKRLSDITNSQSQPKVSSRMEKPPHISPSAEDYINQLIKEKMTLMKLTEEKNKIIELSAAELQNLRINLQKLQLQNRSLAQTNSQFLAEINLGREKLKALQHELLCKDALLKAKNLEREGKAEVNCQETEALVVEEAVGESLNKVNDCDKSYNRYRRRTARSQSMGPSTTHQQGLEKEKVKNKRHCLRRQSAKFKSQKREPTENLFEIEDAKFALSQKLDSPMHEDGVSPSHGFSTKEGSGDPRTETQVSQRSSIGRPLRRVAEKVHSYKEVPLNIKMRRAE